MYRSICLVIIMIFSLRIAKCGEHNDRLSSDWLYATDRLRSMLDENGKATTENVRRLVLFLDDIISSASMDNTSMEMKKTLKSMICILIRELGSGPRISQPQDPNRLTILKELEQDIESDNSIKNKEKMHLLLKIAMGYSGESPNVEVCASLLTGDYNDVLDMKLLVLDSMLASDVPLGMLPYLLRLKDNTYSYTKSSLAPLSPGEKDVPAEFREFPIREKAAEALRRLGVACEIVKSLDSGIDAREGIRLSSTTIKIDKESLSSIQKKYTEQGLAPPLESDLKDL